MIAAVVALPLLAAGAPAADAIPVGWVTVAGDNLNGPAANQFSNPRGVATDRFGNIYVADTMNQRVQRWAPGATTGVTVAGGNGDGVAANQLQYPTGVAVDGHENVYASNAGSSVLAGDRVQRWAPGATAGVTVAGGHGVGGGANQLSTAGGVALDSSGNVYVADAGNHRVQRWAPGATSGVTVAGGRGQGPASNQLDHPWSLTVDADRNVYVADTFNHRVQRWAPGATAGVTVAGGHGAGSRADQLNTPMAVAVDRSGNLYVGDSENRRLQLWRPGATTGETVATGITYPWGVTLDRAANLYLTDSINQRVLMRPGPVVRPGSASVAEGNAGTAVVQVPVTLTVPSIQPVTVAWTTRLLSGTHPGQADPTSDYTPASGTVTFAPGDLAETVTVEVRGDTDPETNEYLAVSFHDPTDASLGGFWGLGFVTIEDDDLPVVLAGTASIPEGGSGPTTLQVPVRLSGPTTRTVTVAWTTLPVPGAPGDQADPASDYVATSGIVTFAPGQTLAALAIEVEGDTLVEPDEYVLVSLHDPVNARVGGEWGLGAGIIVDDDGP